MTSEKLIEYAHSLPGVLCGDEHSEACRRAQDVLTSAAQEVVANCGAIAEKARNEAAVMAKQAEEKRDQAMLFQSMGAANMAEYLRRKILLPPGGCEHCLNAREVPSSLVPGQMTRCPACAGQEATVPQ